MAPREPAAPGLTAVQDLAAEATTAESAALAGSFVAHYLAELDDDEVFARADDLSAFAMSHLAFGRCRAPGETLVDIQPSTDPARSVIRIVSDDAPFMVDTETGCRALARAIEREPANASVPGWPWTPLGFAMRHLPLGLVAKMG